jgi:hypothetical protein
MGHSDVLLVLLSPRSSSERFGAGARPVHPIHIHSSSGQQVIFGAYCFKLKFTPVTVIATNIAHPNDTPFGPILYTAGPNLAGNFTKENNGSDIACPAGFQDAAVICRVQAGAGFNPGPGGFFVIFD